MLGRYLRWFVSRKELNAFSKHLSENPEQEGFSRQIISQKLNHMISVIDTSGVSNNHNRDNLKTKLEYFSETIPGKLAGELARLHSIKSQEFYTRSHSQAEYFPLRFLASYFHVISQSPLGGISDGHRVQVKDKFFSLLTEYEFFIRKLFIDFEEMLISPAKSEVEVTD